MAVPYTFANATSAIPLSQLDSNFATAVTIGNVAVQLGNTATTFGNVTLNSATLNNATAANVTISSVSTPITVAQGGTGLSSYTANAVVYAPTTSTLATGSALTFDGANLGLGVTPSAWGSAAKVLEIGTIGNGFYGSTSSDSHAGMVSGAYQNSGWKYSRTGINPIRFSMNDAVLGQMEWYNASSGTAGNAITWTQAMTLDASGNLLVGATSAADSTVRTQSGSSSKDGRIQGWLSTSNGGGHGVLQLGSANTGTGTECSIQLVSGATALGNSPTSANGTQYVWGMGLGPYGVGGNVFAISNDSYGVNVKLNYNSSSWISVSDERIKNITANIENANQIIANWRTVYYTLKSDETNSVKIGLIAQDVQKTLPEVVDVPTKEYDDNNKLIPLGVHYSEVVPVLVKAIQEQQSTIQSLTERITALEAK